MSYLEKLFLGTMALFALAIFFMFGLYFDVGSMFQGGLDRAGVLTRGEAVDSLIQRLERGARVASVERQAGDIPRGKAADAPRGIPNWMNGVTNLSQYYLQLGTGKPGTGAALVERHREFLRKQGFTNKEFIELEALAQNRGVADRAIAAATRLAEQGNFLEAAACLEAGLSELEPLNHYLRQELLNRLAEVQLRGGDLDRCRQATERLYATVQQILDIKQRSGLMDRADYRAEIELEAQKVRERTATIGTVFDNLRSRVETTGRWDGYTAEEKTQGRMAATGALARGEMTQEQFKSVLQQLEVGFGPERRTREGAAKALDGGE